MTGWQIEKRQVPTSGSRSPSAGPAAPASILAAVGFPVLGLVLSFLTVCPCPAIAGEVLQAPQDPGEFVKMLLATVPGDTVLVGPGDYRGRFYLPAGVVFLSTHGPDSTTLWGDGGTLLEIKGRDPGTVIRGFTLNCRRGSEIAVFAPGGDPLIEGNVITESWYGINCRDAEPTIRGNLIHDCQHGVALEASAGVIEENRILGNRTGVYLTSASPIIQRNRFERNRVGISLEYYSYPIVGGSLSRANDFVDNRRHISNGALATIGSNRTQEWAAMTAKYNYWGDLCPPQEKFFGRCRLKPWTDEAHEGRYIECPEGEAPEEGDGAGGE